MQALPLRHRMSVLSRLKVVFVGLCRMLEDHGGKQAALLCFSPR